MQLQHLQAAGSLIIALLLMTAATDRVDRGETIADEGNRCLWQLKSNKSITRFSSMPGGGWDNLRNKDMGLVADLSFTDCILSDDGMFVLPRNVILYARKESTVEVMSELMEHYNNYTSTLCGSINSGDFGLLGMGPISGTLSEEHQKVKSIAITNKLKIGRSQLRYRMYSAVLQPDFKLSTEITGRLSNIANALVNNRTKMARYLSDLVVRDFGTHVVTSVEAGGVLEKIDFFNAGTNVSGNRMQDKFSASMSVAFHVLLGVSIGGNTTVTKQDIENYQANVSKMSVRSHGGPIMGPIPKLADWIQTLKENLVPVNRDGELLSDVISRRSLPDISATHLLSLRKEIRAAILRYYKANVVKGCMDTGSPNFDPVANLDGGKCVEVFSNFSFAGVFQKCVESNPQANLSLCGAAVGEQANPITGLLSCPDGYEKVPLLTTQGKSKMQCKDKTKRCWIFFTCKDGQECVTSTSRLKAYWCSARKGAHLEPNSGMVFGGSYADDGRFVNEITQAKACSEFYRPYLVGRDIRLCLSMDLHSAARYRIPLAGFFSCNSGNPLADPTRGLVAATGSGANAELPKRCPNGFSQVTLDTVDGCAVMQCVKGRSGLSRLQVRRPPFEDPDYEVLESATPDHEASPMAVGGVVGCLAGVAGTVLVAMVAQKRGSAIRRGLRGLRSRLGRGFNRKAGQEPTMEEGRATLIEAAAGPSSGGSYGPLATDEIAVQSDQVATLKVRMLQRVGSVVDQ